MEPFDEAEPGGDVQSHGDDWAATDPLAIRLAADLDGAFPAVVHAHADLVYGIALRSTGQPAAAEDLAQEALVRAYRALSRYPPERVRALHVRPWLSRITVNLARNRARDRRARPTDVPFEAVVAPLVDGATRPDEAVIRREADAAWEARLAALPRHYRLAVELRHVHGLSYAELAEALDRPVNTVKVHVHRGVALLRTAYRQEIDP
ncbi:MAG: RNA polymerase sigma factor [Candidatus Limnocylindrales bacterium]